MYDFDWLKDYLLPGGWFWYKQKLSLVNFRIHVYLGTDER
uniref:Uncharacterized protein n=1 Tax=Moniliophthora roreri TaxID=221103 RepID=A0A0W0EYF8_MONRR